MMAENIQDGLIIVENGNFVFANHRIAEYHRIFKQRTYTDEILLIWYLLRITKRSKRW